MNKQIIKYNKSLLKKIEIGNNQIEKLMNQIKIIKERNYEQKFIF